MLKQAHYKFSPEMRPRYRRDPFAGPEAFVARAGAFDLFDHLGPQLVDPHLVSSVFGSIERLLFTAPSYVFDYPAYSQPYQDLLGKLPGNTDFFFLVHERARQSLETMIAAVGAQARSTIVEAPDFMRFTVWAEDAYAVTQEGGAGTSFLVEPASFARAQDALIADIMAAATDLDLDHASLYYQGGNILIGDDFWLLGTDYPNRSLALGLVVPEPGETKLEAVQRAYGGRLDSQKQLFLVGSTIPVPSQAEQQFTMNGQTWVEELYAGNSPGTVQPMFHIDMFVTLAGRSSNGTPIALVGDPRLASDILQEPLLPQAMAPVYDDIAAKLVAQGFEVVRNPLPLVYQDDPSRRRRYWYFATSNNALVQVVGASKQVWLPTYGYGDWSDLQATDNANRDVWEGLGFTVEMLGDFHPFAFNLGAVHCIKKYLLRG